MKMAYLFVSGCIQGKEAALLLLFLAAPKAKVYPSFITGPGFRVNIKTQKSHKFSNNTPPPPPKDGNLKGQRKGS